MTGLSIRKGAAGNCGLGAVTFAQDGVPIKGHAVDKVVDCFIDPRLSSRSPTARISWHGRPSWPASLRVFCVSLSSFFHLFIIFVVFREVDEIFNLTLL